MLHHQVDRIRASLERPLPGWPAQREMAPAPRRNRPREGEPSRRAAVLVLLYPRADDHALTVTLLRRPPYGGVHGGQLCLPGGRQEREETLVETALRETYEEIGVGRERIAVLGRLTQIYIPGSNYDVRPFVGFLTRQPCFRADPREVAEILEVPLRHLLAPDARRIKRVKDSVLGERVIPYFGVGEHELWGATAMILNEFIAVMTRPDGAGASAAPGTPVAFAQ